MSTITYENITVEGIPFRKILELYISHAPNTHGKAMIKGIVASDFAQEFVKRADETFGVEITTSAGDQPSRLFYGMISNLSLEQQTEYAVLTIVSETTSRKLDAKKNNRTFQNTGQTYGQMLNSVVSGVGSVTIMGTDKPIGSLIMQYEETDWEFIVRMASQLGVPAFCNIVAKQPLIYIGVPPASRSKEIEAAAFDYSKSEASYQSLTANTAAASNSLGEDFASRRIQAYDYMYLGDTVQFNGKSGQVKTIEVKLVDGILECSYSMALKTGFVVPSITNKNASGRMLTGTVKAVEADKVQVFLHSVDKEYDGGGDWWFPYSTAYSSQDGSGWYSMPAEGDEVRVFFPSDNEADAFAASSVCKNVRSNVKDKCWSGVNGKQILMTEEGLVIICKEGKLYLKLSEEKGIEIISDMDVNITSGTKVNIQGGEEVKIIAKNEVLVGTASSYLDIRNEGIVASADNIIIS